MSTESPKTQCAAKRPKLVYGARFSAKSLANGDYAGSVTLKHMTPDELFALGRAVDAAKEGRLGVAGAMLAEVDTVYDLVVQIVDRVEADARPRAEGGNLRQSADKSGGDGQ